jgi:coat protein Gp5
MPNTLGPIVPKILAMGLMSLREKCVLPRLVNASYANEAAMFGATIDVPIPTKQAAGDVTPSNTPPTPTNNNMTTVQIALNKWKKSDFFLTDKDLREIDKNQSFVPMQMSEAIRALANQVNADIHAEYKEIYGYWFGPTAGPPFGTTDNVTSATNARKVLNKQVCPLQNRRGVLNFDAEANALALPAFSNVEQVGEQQAKIEGVIGRKFGIDWYADDQVLTHVSTPLSAGAATVNGAHAAGVGSTDNGKTGTVSIAKATNPSNLVKGDIITFASDPQTYVVMANVTLAVGNTTVSISPALQVAKAGGEAMTLAPTHVVNLVFHRDAFAFANRPVATGLFSGGSEIAQMTDPVTGISMALEVSRQYHQTSWEFSLLYGARLVRPEFAMRLAGT